MRNMKIGLFVLVLCCMFLYSCSAASRYVSFGDKAIARGDYYAAAQDYLTALKAKPGYTKAVMKLSQVARPAYDQKLSLAEGYKNQGSLEAALREYKELKQFLRDLRSSSALNFVPLDIDKAISSVSEGAAEEHFKQAEAYFSREDYGQAIREYEEALDFTPSYKDCREKISESYYCLGTQLQAQKGYRAAAENFGSACDNIRQYKDAAEKSALLYYSLGCYFLENGQYRKAYEDLVSANTMYTGFQEVDQKLSEAREGATVRIAFVRFDNPTRQNIAGIAMGDFIFESLKTKLQSQMSQFIRVLDRDELAVIAREQQISAGMLSGDATGPINLEGVDCLIFGKLNQVRDHQAGLSRTRMQGEYTFHYEETYIDNKGRRRTRPASMNYKMSYRLNKDELTLNLSGVIKIIETDTGAVLINHQISEEGFDSIAYADDVYAAHDPNSSSVGLPDYFKELWSARQELRDSGVLVKDMINSISQQMSSKILTKLDQTPLVSDPVSLDLK